MADDTSQPLHVQTLEVVRKWIADSLLDDGTHSGVMEVAAYLDGAIEAGSRVAHGTERKLCMTCKRWLSDPVRCYMGLVPTNDYCVLREAKQ